MLEAGRTASSASAAAALWEGLAAGEGGAADGTSAELEAVKTAAKLRAAGSSHQEALESVDTEEAKLRAEDARRKAQKALEAYAAAEDRVAQEEQQEAAEDVQRAQEGRDEAEGEVKEAAKLNAEAQEDVGLAQFEQSKEEAREAAKTYLAEEGAHYRGKSSDESELSALEEGDGAARPYLQDAHEIKDGRRDKVGIECVGS